MSIVLIIHCDDETVAKICREYWNCRDDGTFHKTVSAVALDYGITQAEISKIVKHSSTAYSKHSLCNQCKTPRIIENRSALKSATSDCRWICEKCKRENIKAENNTKQEAVDAAYLKAVQAPVDINHLPTRASILLMAIMKHGESENLDEIGEYISNKTELLSPNKEYDLSIIKELYRDGIIAVSPNSNMAAINLIGNGKFSFYIDQVKWCIPLADSTPMSEFYSTLEARITSKYLLENDYESVATLCQEICKIECLNYLELALAEHQLGFNPGEKTNRVISNALQHFSVSQIYCFIWRAAKDAAAFYARNRTSRDHAAKTIVSNIERQFERALAGNWNAPSYRRNYVYPQSVLSRVMFNALLGTDDAGFHQKLSEIL